MPKRPTSPLDRDGVPRLTVFGVLPCQDTAITRSRLEALNAPYLYVDLDHDAAAEARVRLLNDGNRVTPTVVVGAEETVAPEPDIAAVDHLAELAWPGLPMERPRLSLPLPRRDAWADTLVTPPPPAVTPAGLVELPADADPLAAAGEPGVPSRWASGPASHLALVFLAHAGCLACLGYSRQLLNRRPELATTGCGVAVVLRGELPGAVEWRARMAADARVLADPGSAWSRRMLDRLIAEADTPGSSIRHRATGVAMLLVDGEGRVARMATGPEAGHLPDPAYLAEAIALEAASRSIA